MDNGQEQVDTIIRDLGQIDFGWILWVFVLALAANYLIQKILPWVAERVPGRFRLYILPLVPILRLVVLLIAARLIVPEFIEISFQNVLAILGAIALALGFAFKDWISSIVAGVVAIYEQPYRVGDWVEIDGDYGEVQQLGLRALTLTTPDDSLVTIPHQKLWDSNITNASNGHREHMVVAHFYVHPRHDARQVRQVLWDVGVTSPYTQIEKPVLVIVQEKPWGTHYQLKAYPIDGRDEFVFLSDLTVRGKAALAAIDVEQVSFPISVEMNQAQLQ